MEDLDDDVPVFPLGWKLKETKSRETNTAILKSGKALKNLKAPTICCLKAKCERRKKRFFFPGVSTFSHRRSIFSRTPLFFLT